MGCTAYRCLMMRNVAYSRVRSSFVLSFQEVMVMRRECSCLAALYKKLGFCCCSGAVHGFVHILQAILLTRTAMSSGFLKWILHLLHDCLLSAIHLPDLKLRNCWLVDIVYSLFGLNLCYRKNWIFTYYLTVPSVVTLRILCLYLHTFILYDMFEEAKSGFQLTFFFFFF